MHIWFFICFLCLAQVTFGRRRQSAPNELNERFSKEVRPNKRECRQCSEFFIGEGLSICRDLFCYTDKTRPSMKNKRRCRSCSRRFQDEKQRNSCIRIFCQESSNLNPTTTPSSTPFSLALTANILCSYCQEKTRRDKGLQCLKKFGCLTECFGPNCSV